MARRDYQADLGQRPRRVEGAEMTDDDIRTLTDRYLQDARNFMQEEISPERSKAWLYYNGQVDHKPPKGRSKIVMTEVRDTVESVMPDLMDIFASSKYPVEFEPTHDEDVDLAKQQTGGINYVFMKQNKGWQNLYNYVKDGLVSKTGIFKTYWTEEVEIDESEYSGLSPDEFALISGDDEVEVLEYEEGEEGIDCKIRRTQTKGRAVVETVPPEEFLIDRRATCVEDARFVGQKGQKRISELVAAGYDRDTVEQLAYSSDDYEEEEREQRADYQQDRKEDVDDDLVDVYDCYILLDHDNDGISNLLHVVLAGEQRRLLEWETYDEAPYSIGSPYPTPHASIGKSLADITFDMQDSITAMTRQILDNAYRVNNPQKACVEGQVNIGDVLDNKYDGVIRVRQPGMVEPITVPWIGDEALAVVDHLDRRKQWRTGISAESMGLDADALQSSSEVGVRGVLGAAQKKPKMIARCLAETGLSMCFYKLLKLLIRHQNKSMVIRLNNEFVKVDPRDWNADMDLTVNVGLGTGDKEEQIAILTAIKEEQKQILMTLGPNNPLVTMRQYRNTLAKLTELGGYKNTDDFFGSEEQLIAYEQQQANSPPPETQDPEVLKAQAEIAQKQQEAQMKMQLEIQKQQAQMALEVEKAKMQFALEQWKAQQEMQLAQMQAGVDVQVQVAETQADVALRERELEMEAVLERYKIDAEVPSGQGDIERPN